MRKKKNERQTLPHRNFSSHSLYSPVAWQESSAAAWSSSISPRRPYWLCPHIIGPPGHTVTRRRRDERMSGCGAANLQCTHTNTRTTSTISMQLWPRCSKKRMFRRENGGWPTSMRRGSVSCGDGRSRPHGDNTFGEKCNCVWYSAVSVEGRAVYSALYWRLDGIYEDGWDAWPSQKIPSRWIIEVIPLLRPTVLLLASIPQSKPAFAQPKEKIQKKRCASRHINNKQLFYLFICWHR